MAARIFLAALLTSVTATAAHATPCDPEDFETKVTGVSQCLLIRRFGPTAPARMVVWIHGDVSSGGPANYHFRYAQQAALEFSASNVMSVAVVRPGYPDGTGESSTVSFLHSGRFDHYTRENLEEVGAVIEKLRQKYKPETLVLVGHSGGAATAAVLIGTKADLADGAVLVSCPCELVSWRMGRRSWTRSENPTDWIGKISPSTRVIALTGTKDDNTPQSLAIAYVDALKARGIRAAFQPIPDGAHLGVLGAREVTEAIGTLLYRPAPENKPHAGE